MDVVVIGNVGVDTNVYFGGHGPDFSRETNFTENVDCVGQAGGYASRGFARMEKRTAFIGYVGDDHNGRLVREVFRRDGVDMRGLFIDPAGTCRSMNCMYRDGTRRNFFDGKGHMRLSPDLEVCAGVLRGARLAHFNIPNWARWVLPVARSLGAVVSCDLQDVVEMPDAYRADFVRSSDIVFFSCVNHSDPKPLMEALLRENPKQIVVVGMGARGCALGTDERGVELYDPVELERPVVDANGAGDGLAVGFLSSYVLDGFSLADSILRGQIAARHTCALRGSSDALITRAELDRVFAAMTGV